MTKEDEFAWIDAASPAIRRLVHELGFAVVHAYVEEAGMTAQEIEEITSSAGASGHAGRG